MHQLDVHTVGGVITAGEPIMLIVPEADKLHGRGQGQRRRTSTRCSIGQTPLLRFSAFNQRTTPEINGDVSRVSRRRHHRPAHRPELLHDPHRHAGRRRWRGSATSSSFPGMPVEAFVQTGDRTVMSYLIKPLHDQLMRMFREK